MAFFKGKKNNFLTWLIIIVLIIVLVRVLPGLTVEWLWLDNLGFSSVFWKIKGAQFLLLSAAFILALIYILPNLRLLSKNVSPVSLNLGNTPLGQVGLGYVNNRQLKRFLLIAGIITSFFFSLSYFLKWDDWFRFIRQQPFGQKDPIFGHDIGFYMFSLPFIEIVQNSFTYLTFIVTFFLIFIYFLNGSLTLERVLRSGYHLSKAVKHICFNLGIWLFLLSIGYFLDRYKILYNPGGVVFGAGYTDTHVYLPVLWGMTIMIFLLSIYSFVQIRRQNTRMLVKYLGFVLSIGIVGQAIIPMTVQSTVVKPNELNMETPYLENNIQMTRQAYGLDKFDETSYNASEVSTYDEVRKNMQTIDNIRLWDSRPILETYRQLQEIRLYYTFPSISINRYHTERGYEQMMVAGREIAASKLPGKAQTWVNRHLQYTHGYGITMSPVAETSEDGNPVLLIKDLPPVSEINLKLEQPAIYYGETPTDFKLVNTLIKELDYPEGKDNVYTHYDGKGGVPIDNFFRKFLFSVYFGDYNLLLTEYIKKGSRIQFWRDIQTRINRAAPFLELKEAPYLVLNDGKLYWIQDAYTSSSNYPYSQPYNGEDNYIRNSVKVVINAYEGDVQFFIADEEDQVLKVYRKIFPDIFQPMSQMPGTLIKHIRYPDYLFRVQMGIYNTYHMTNPQTFYNNEDLWDIPNSKYAGREIKMESYYIVSKLPGEDKLKYLLISPLTPHNRDNMISWMAAESDFPDYGKVHVYELPKSRLFIGPAQIEAKIDQNTEISQQLSLWDQRGSSVIRGNLMIIPIEKSFIYVEPVFLIADGVNIPQLKRVIATMGDKVVMEPTLHEAINSLFEIQPQMPIGRDPQTTPELPADTEKISNPGMDSLRVFWSRMQQALKNQQWQQFGRQMEKIDSIMKE